MEAKGRQRTDGSLELTVLDGEKAVFLPEKPLSMDRWFVERNQADEEAEKKKTGNFKRQKGRGKKEIKTRPLNTILRRLTRAITRWKTIL